ncbi:hypothetical protein [Nonomuraea sp. NPDC048826]|uniref:hypothetical protein n=1 Tax=Nonomuraea sp. NPDC048826 TaxID=3364347 RepID=UPI003720FCC9
MERSTPRSTDRRASTPSPTPAPQPQAEPTLPAGLPGPDPCATFHDFRRDACYQVLNGSGR